jgi:cysteinyl-tRNA synthetase
VSYEAVEMDAAVVATGELRAAAWLPSGDGPVLDATPYRKRFLAAMDNDLDTPTAVSVLSDLGKVIQVAAAEGRNLSSAQAQLRELGGILGLHLGQQE